MYLILKYILFFLDAERMFVEQEELIVLLSKRTDELNTKMSENLEKINSQSEYYRTCNN